MSAVYDAQLICLVADDDLCKLPLFYPPNVAWKTCQFVFLQNFKLAIEMNLE